MSDMYQRPSREAIAAQVKAQQPITPQEGDAARNFARHVAARMQAQGLTAKDVAEKSGAGNAAVSYALGTGSRCVSLDAAEKIAIAVGGYLAHMIGPYICQTCAGSPPKGFICKECRSEGGTA